jgi:hypothetical protein
MIEFRISLKPCEPEHCIDELWRSLVDANEWQHGLADETAKRAVEHAVYAGNTTWLHKFSHTPQIETALQEKLNEALRESDRKVVFFLAKQCGIDIYGDERHPGPFLYMEHQGNHAMMVFLYVGSEAYIKEQALAQSGRSVDDVFADYENAWGNAITGVASLKEPYEFELLNLLLRVGSSTRVNKQLLNPVIAITHQAHTKITIEISKLSDQIAELNHRQDNGVKQCAEDGELAFQLQQEFALARAHHERTDAAITLLKRYEAEPFLEESSEIFLNPMEPPSFLSEETVSQFTLLGYDSACFINDFTFAATEFDWSVLDSEIYRESLYSKGPILRILEGG